MFVAVVLRAKDAMLLPKPPAKVIATYFEPCVGASLIITPDRKAAAETFIDVIWAVIEPSPFKI